MARRGSSGSAASGAFMKNRTRIIAWCLLSSAFILIPAVGRSSPQGEGQPQQGGQSKPPAHPLPWAYGVPEVKPPAEPEDDGRVYHLPETDAAFTLKEIRNGTDPVDWYPGDHPTMPNLVAHGRKPDVNACAFCHFPNGKGRPENAMLAGLPYAYIVQQLTDFKNGARRSFDPGKANTARMAGFAKGLTEEEVSTVAKYFSSMKQTPWEKVVETDSAPKAINVGGYFVTVEGHESEPIGNRLLEVPADTDKTFLLRDPRSPFVVYVPPGTLKKGEMLVTKGGGDGKTVACAACHGDGLKGNGYFPPLAGRSPSYLGRQLYDFQHYTRNGPGAQLMQPIVAKLTDGDILAIAAYVASLPVQ